ncbi:MAG: 50S ribosomal protein L25 [Planctomycetota bacterium]|jgi:large subunit ribosomal protein L25
MGKRQDTPTIQVNKRDRTGSAYARRLRRQGRLPAVIYGHKQDPLHVSVDAKEILTYIRGGTHVLSLQVDGEKAKAETCLVKDLQFGYLGDDVVHIDFARVKLDEEVEVHVHLNFVGEAVAAQKSGAIVNYDMTGLEVTCRVDAIPEEIKVDLGTMGEETVLTVADIALPPGVRAAGDPEAPVVHISFVKKEEEPAVGEEAEVAAPEEPEVISEAKEGEEKEQEKEE